MTIPRLSDMVREMIPFMRARIPATEAALIPHLRGNEPLYSSLCNLVRERISGRAQVAEPTDPIACKSMVARDRELQWLLSRLDSIYRAPINQEATNDGEPPA